MRGLLRPIVPGLLCAISFVMLPRVLHAQSMQDIFEKAKLEKELVIYGGGPTSLYEVPAREFERRFPGIKVSISSGFSNVLDRKIDEQLQAKKLEADLAILQTVQDFIRWKKEGVLANFRPEGFDA